MLAMKALYSKEQHLSYSVLYHSYKVNETKDKSQKQLVL